MKKALPFQEDGIGFLRNRGNLLADDPGLGKTFQALTAVAALESRHPVLVTCPSSVAGVWQAEMLDLSPEARVLRLTSDNIRRLSEPWDMIVTSVDLPGRNTEVAAALQALRYDAFIADEAHYLANDSDRTRTILTGSHALIRRASGLRIMLTGTPTPAHVGNLWPLISATAPSRIKNATRKQFEERYCRFKMLKLPNGREVRVPAGNNARAELELKELLRMGDVPWWLRRKKRDVIDFLPKKTERRVLVDVRNLRAYKDFLDSAEGRIVARAIETRSMAELMSRENRANLARLRRIMGEAKAQEAANYLSHILRDEKPSGVVVWAWHTGVLDIIEKQLVTDKTPFVRIDGSTPGQMRTARVAEFQKEDGPKVFLGQIVAAGTGITLTKADRSLFVERAWTPATNVQAEDRIDRIGQQASTIMHERMILADSLDEVIEAINETRAREWAKLEEGAL